MKKIMLLFESLLVISCTYHEKQIYKEFPYDLLIEWNDVFSQDGDYYVYFYSEICGHCESIKQEMITWIQNCGHIFIVDVLKGGTYKNDYEGIKNITNINDLYILGTPTIYGFVNHTINEYYVGTESILKFLEKWYSTS